MRSRTRLVGAVAIIVAVVGAAVIGRRGGDQTPARARPNRSRDTGRQWEQLERAGQKEAHSIVGQSWPFSELISTRPQIPLSLRVKAEEVLGHPQNLNLWFEKARRVTAPNTDDLWLIPGSDVLCLFQAIPAAAACKTTAQAYRDGLVLQLYRLHSVGDGRPTRFTSVGVIPDGVKRIPVKIGRHWAFVPVAHNVFSLASSQPIGVPSLSMAKAKRLGKS